MFQMKLFSGEPFETTDRFIHREPHYHKAISSLVSVQFKKSSLPKSAHHTRYGMGAEAQTTVTLQPKGR
jgi:hypothetical protein